LSLTIDSIDQNRKRKKTC